MKAVIEHVLPNQVDGWAYRDDAPDKRVVVELCLDGQVIAKVRAENYREDLRRNGVGDGCYGYVFANVLAERLPNAYVDGQLTVRASDVDGCYVLAEPAFYLKEEIAGFLQRQILESHTFEEFISFVESTRSVDPEIAGQSLDLVNASRVHFPEWSKSTDFLQLSIDLSKRAKRPHTQQFYEGKLKECADPIARPRIPDGVHFEPIPDTYGAPRRLGDSDARNGIKIIEPRFLSGGHRTSFLQEAGILRENDRSPIIKVLAFREDAFGGASWWIKKNGSSVAAARNLYYLDFELLRSILDDGGYLIIDMSNEGPPAESNWIEVLNNALIELEIDPRQIILVNQNLKFGLGSVENKFLGHVAIAHYFISKSITILKSQLPDEYHLARHCQSILGTREQTPIDSLKYFICLNFTPRWFRWATVLHLSSHGLLRKGYVSFPGHTNFKLQDALDLQSALPALHGRQKLLLEVPNLLAACPLELDIHGSTTTSPDFEYPMSYMARSLFQIVTESEMSDGNGILRVTEKIIKPIVGLQPFIVAGNPGSLVLLRNMGFRTFGSVFDESYDSITNPGARLDAVFNEIDRLTNMPLDDLKILVAQLNETLIYNFRHLMLVGPLIFNHAVEHRLHKMIE